jgi:hypothetical protein
MLRKDAEPLVRGTFDMLLVRSIVAVMVLSFVAARAAAQDATDATMRAAYCVGVLKESLKHREHQAAEGMPAEVRDLLETLSKNLEARRKRYARYMALGALDMCPSQISTTMALIAKGERDVADKQLGPINPAISRCLTSHRSSVADLVDCVASFDPVEANILRCKSEPDGPPF